MSLFDEILSGKTKISLVGLGYVGMPIAVAFAKKAKVIGFDLNSEKIATYKSGIDPTCEVGDDVIKNTTFAFLTCLPASINCLIIASPTNAGISSLICLDAEIILE